MHWEYQKEVPKASATECIKKWALKNTSPLKQACLSYVHCITTEPVTMMCHEKAATLKYLKHLLQQRVGMIKNRIIFKKKQKPFTFCINFTHITPANTSHNYKH